jgi:hypothetical protein
MSTDGTRIRPSEEPTTPPDEPVRPWRALGAIAAASSASFLVDGRYRMPVNSQMSGEQTEICTRSAVDVVRFPADVLMALHHRYRLRADDVLAAVEAPPFVVWPTWGEGGGGGFDTGLYSSSMCAPENSASASNAVLGRDVERIAAQISCSRKER